MEPLAKEGHFAVTGVQFGDEGKGQIVDALSEDFAIVTRYNGGANAGHSVWLHGTKYALHLVPCGILREETVNVIGNGVVVDPEVVLEEIKILTGEDVRVDPENLKISDRAHVVFPYHMLEDKIRDQIMADKKSGEGHLGTTKRGIGPCYADKAHRSTAIRMTDLIHPDRLKALLPRIVEVKNAQLEAMSNLAGMDYATLHTDDILTHAVEMGKKMKPYVCDTQQLLFHSIASGKRILFEGANAILLDVDFGTYPFVTSSNTSSLGIYSGAGIPGGTLSETVGVAKLYMSRVGTGPFPTELHGAIADEIRTTASEYGTTTGRPRRIGWLDLVALKHALQLNGTSGIAVTGLSMLSGIDPIQVCTGYGIEGASVDSFPADVEVLSKVKPMYKTFAGFSDSVADCSRKSDLPPEALKYLEFVEGYVGVPIKAICVGKSREQIIMR